MAFKIFSNIAGKWEAYEKLARSIATDLASIAALANEVRTDHATFKTAADAVETLIEELHDDHATFKTAVDETKTLIDELHDDHATVRTWIVESDADQDVINNTLDYLGRGVQVVGGSFTITAGAAVTLTGAGFVTYAVDGDLYYSDLDTTITLADGGDIAAGNWGAWRILIARDGTVTTQDTGATPMAYATEEDALLNLSAVAPTANTVTIGYFTIHSNGGFNIGTDNVNGETAANVYHVRGAKNKVSGLTAALGAAVTADAAAGTWSSGTIDAKRNGLRLAQIAAIANQAVDDADTIADGNAGGWLLVTNLAGTGVYLLAADGAAGAVSAMTYADTAAVDTAIDTLVDQLPEIFCPVGKIVVANASGGLFTAGATNWDAAGVTTTETDCTYGTWDRTANTGFDSNQIFAPAVPASITAPIVATLTAAKPTAGPATLTAAKPASAPASLSASAITLGTTQS
jgi:hypothetical protein